MVSENKPIDNLVIELQERAKELNCLYTIEDSLNRSDISLRQAFHTVINAIPPGWQFPHLCRAKLVYGGIVYQTSDFEETKWFIESPIIVQEKTVGYIKVFYIENAPPADYGPFLKEEKKLLDTIAERLGHFILHQKLKNVFAELKAARESFTENTKGEWRIILDMIRKTDPNLFMSLLRKILHLLCWKGVEEAEMLMKHASIKGKKFEEINIEDENKPSKVPKITNYDEYVDSILRLADENFTDEIILARIQKWIQEDKSSLLVKVVENQDTSLTDIADAIRKYYHLAPEKFELPPSTIKGLRVSLLRRFFTDQLEFIRVAKDYVKLTDFYRLIDKMIFPQASHGKLGGKSAGLFLAYHLLQKESDNNPIFKEIKVPNTWYLTSDCVLYFLQYNNLEEVYEQKYKEIEEVRIEYPHLVQLFKNSEFPADIVKGLSVALDDLGDKPLIVRSSSLLEDQLGATFSGKYKSLFLANQGTKQQRLIALMDAIAEVYASTFSPDPIEYRAEKGLLDFHEEMGIMIQEVVGTKVGHYFLPAFAGVAFSNNEFRWSPRIRREDGLIRIVPGLGTRAVDRLSDDYPILAAPAVPSLRVNVTPDEMVRYSPKKIDVINLKTNEFESISLTDLLKQYGNEFPMLQKIFSVYDGNMVRPATQFDLNDDKYDFIATFDELFSRTDFLKKVDVILKTLQAKIGAPVDIEFAHNGKDFYLLQCRPQSFSSEISADYIPKDVPSERIIFTARKYVSNGKVPEITHIVYVDPIQYSQLGDRNKMLQVGRAVGKLNKLLPKRRFVLMGPGRWGSRGDIKLGVSVTYSEINNTAMLIEIARKKGNYLPDLSFGTHFFQDLVESRIRYLPLYPDDPGIIFNEEFLTNSKNILREILPEYSYLEETIKVLDISALTDGLILKILLNAELGEAIGYLTSPSAENELERTSKEIVQHQEADHWRWRMKMAEKIASELDAEKFGVKGIYVFGSTKNAVAGPGSDIDLLVHIENDKMRIEELNLWFEGWSLCLSEMNYQRTGYKSQGLLDVHYITDEDIANKNSYAMKIGAVTDAARPLKTKQKKNL
ncbi:PEP/pyruvate-binding domain-containing protein [Melioribacteraceae bacterium 4301-Me]|uniref:PEP/pyruvate-binding domain-containing protein n=1 Tax=Pyranulibacter aquaticus TaxID=3163344 RepID=UPI00359AA9FB